MDREEFLRQEIAEYKRRLGVYPVLIAEWERELGETVPAAGSPDVAAADKKTTAVAPGTDPVTLIRGYEFNSFSQPDAARTFLERFGKPLTTDELIAGLEKGGLKLGGETYEKKKANFASTLIRAENIVRVGRGTWALGTKPHGKSKHKDDAGGGAKQVASKSDDE